MCVNSRIYRIDEWKLAAGYPPAVLEKYTRGLPEGIPMLNHSGKLQIPNAIYWLRQVATFGNYSLLRSRAIDLLMFGHIALYPDGFNDISVVQAVKVFCACGCDVTLNEDWGCIDIEINDGEPVYHVRDMYDLC